jgi:predicted ATPase
MPARTATPCAVVASRASMLTHIKLQQFRGFASLDTDLEPLTVIAGPNSSGKTSILHAVRMAFEALAIGLEEEDPHADAGRDMVTVCRDHIIRDQERLCPVPDWKELFTNRDMRAGMVIGIEATFERSDLIQKLHVAFAPARNDQLKMTVLINSSEARKRIDKLPKQSKYRSQGLREALEGALPQAVFVPAFYGVTRAEEYRTRALIDGMLGGGDQSRIVRNLVTRLDGPAFGRLNDFLRRSIGASLVRRTMTDEVEDARYLTAYFKDTNGELELSSAGSGLINLIALYAAMERFRPARQPGSGPVVFLLDEPEAHLHPKLQGDVGEALGNLRADFVAQLVIATHSVEMVNRLSQRPEARLLAVDRATSSVTVLASDEAMVRELGRWCDLTPFSSLNFLASRRILFHEGPSDAAILSRCADLCFRTDTPGLDRFRAFTMVSLDGVGNAKAQGMLRAVLTPKLFPELTATQKVRALCLFDRDAERSPGLHSIKALTNDHFEGAEMVWSQYSIESLFLTPKCLAAWLALLLPSNVITEDDLAKLVEGGLAEADKDLELLDAATSALLQAKLRPRTDPTDPKKRSTMPLPDALKEAQQEARAKPAVWQKGRDRASKVLSYVRDALPKRAQNKVRGSITAIVEAAPIDRLGDPNVLLPPEVRDLLNHLASA